MKSTIDEIPRTKAEQKAIDGSSAQLAIAYFCIVFVFGGLAAVASQQPLIVAVVGVAIGLVIFVALSRLFVIVNILCDIRDIQSSLLLTERMRIKDESDQNASKEDSATSRAAA